MKVQLGFLLMFLLSFSWDSMAQQPEAVKINPEDGVIELFPGNPEEGKISRYQYSGKQVWIDAIRIGGKTRQIRIAATPESRSKTLVKFKYPFGDASVTWNMDVTRSGDVVSVTLPWNAVLIGERMDVREGESESELIRKKLGVTGPVDAGLPVVYSTGNSISLGYWPYLEKELWRDVNVYHIRELFMDMPETRCPNPGLAGDSYSSLVKAYQNEFFKPDYILVNFGLHMINGYHNNLKGYGEWIQKFIDLAKANDAKLIWVTTTPYALYREDKNKIVQQFNDIAKRIIEENNMYLVDLYSCVKKLVKERNEWNVYTDGVHFREEIKAKFGEFIARHILEVKGKTASKEKSRLNTIDSSKEMHIFLLMGQSNMSGFGKVLPGDTIPVPNIFSIPTIDENQYTWKPAAHPLHNRLPSDRFGLGLPFAKEYLKHHPNVQVGLIPVAWGGTKIHKHSKGAGIYKDAIAKAHFASKYGIIKGILWHQGEGDTVNKEFSSSYENKLHQLVNDLRKDLGIANLPFIAGNLAEFYGTNKDHSSPSRVEQINEVKAALRNLPGKVENTGFVESSGCSSPDHHNVHFDRKSYIILGKRYAEAFEQIENK